MTKLTKLLAFVLIILLTQAVQIKKQKKCIALALEGGGDMGSYQVGVLKAFADNLPDEDLMYDVITGVSVGSINAMGIALHPMGKEKDAINWMVNLWGLLGPTSIYVNWPFGIPQGLFFQEGIWNNNVELDFLNKTFHTIPNAKVSRRIHINTVDIDTGVLYKYNETTPLDDLVYAVKASTSMPLAFTHTHFQNHTFIDGGSYWNLDLSGAIERCLEVVDSYKDIIVDVVLCDGPNNITDYDPANYNTISNYSRYRSIKTYYSVIGDLNETMRGYPDVNFRYLVYPKEPLPHAFIPLVFDHDKMAEMTQIGMREGKAAIEEKNETTREKVARISKDSWLSHQ